MLVLSLLCLGTASENAYAAKAKEPPKLADVIDSVRPSVVQVLVQLIPTGGADPRRQLPLAQIPPALRGCLSLTGTCILGTGFFVDSDGDVVTAYHVADGYRAADGSETLGVKQVIEMLRAAGVRADLEIGVATPNFEDKAITVASNTEGFPAAFVATDPVHDLALIRPTVNPFAHMQRAFGGPAFAGVPQATVKYVTFSPTRPRDAEEIFACGYPFSTPGLVTTSGTVASAWNQQVLIRAAEAGYSSPQDVYTVDLRLNPGNSGGPVFKLSDQSVIGVAVQSFGSLAVVVPSKFVTAFLTSHGVSWTPATTSSKKAK